MKDRREINIEVFEDTMKHYKSNPTLKAAVSNSVANQKFTAAAAVRRIHADRYGKRKTLS
jgi:hypothetical protein